MNTKPAVERLDLEPIRQRASQPWPGGLVLKADIQTLIAEVERLRAAEAGPPNPFWQSIETAQKDGRDVLVWTLTGQSLVVRWDDGRWGWQPGCVPTHWMPLPISPLGALVDVALTAPETPEAPRRRR